MFLFLEFTQLDGCKAYVAITRNNGATKISTKSGGFTEAIELPSELMHRMGHVAPITREAQAEIIEK